MTETHDRVCPATAAGFLDNRVRKLLQNPVRLLSPFVRPGMTALDFGCGPGFFTLDLARLVGPTGRVVAADLQEAMLARLRSKLAGTALESRVTPHQCRSAQLGLALRLDFALAYYVLHELPDQRAFFTELRPLLCPAGQLLVVEPPLHVTRAEFARTVQSALDAGYLVAERPSVPFNKAVLLRPS